ncbi:MAG: hypothetical protein ACI81P_001411, partial [Neolewinella sp.]
MKQVQQLFMLALCLLGTMTLTAQVYEVNLANIARINLTLNDECQALVIPEMVLTGDFDVDGDGEVPGDEYYQITVMDNNPTNGSIVDGCGEFQYKVEIRDFSPANTEGFTGDFSPENWTLEAFYVDGFPIGLSGDIGMAQFTDPETITFTTLGDNFGVQLVALGSIQATEGGTVTLDYDYNGADAGFDDAIILTDFEGNLIEIVLDTDMPESGSVSFEVEAGYTIVMAIVDDGFTPIADNTPSILRISNWGFAPVDLSIPVTGFVTSWGIVNAEDKTSPVADVVPDDVTLLCVDFDGNNAATLPTSVDRCYRVNASNGATISSSMANALRARLLAGGIAPLVPIFTDGCAQELQICVSDAVVFGDDPSCDDIVITRTFVATEISTCVSAAGEGNAPTVVSYDLTFERPTLADLDTDNIEDVVTIEQCGTANPTRADYPAPRVNDFPFLVVGDRTFPLVDGEAVCNIGVTYSDGEAIVTCPFTYKFVRTYTVIDWCDP